MELFAENLKRLRKERNMTQDQLAHVSDIPKGTICNYEQNRGGCDPSLHNLMVWQIFLMLLLTIYIMEERKK